VVDDRRLGVRFRARRHQRGWRLIDLAAAAGVGATACSMLERGQAAGMSVRLVRAIGAALDLPVGWDLGWQRQELDRLLDADHAALGGHVIRRLGRWGWECQAEASFNSFGDRGRIDVIAIHRQTRTLLVIELKTVIVDGQELLGRLDVKARIAPDVARRLGWSIGRVVPAIIVSDTTTNRRRVASLEPLLGRYDVRGRTALSWLRRPIGPANGLLILTEVPVNAGSDARRAGRRRVRVRRPRKAG
jgi:transcriptional regulator with XRE-family HTH domain